MAIYASLRRVMNGLVQKNLARMAAQTIVVGRLDARMRSMAFVTIQSRHRDLGRECCLRGCTMAGQAPLAVRDKCALFPGRKGVACHAGNLFHAHAVDFPVLVAPKARRLIRPERVYGPAVAIHAGKPLHIDVPRVAC